MSRWDTFRELEIRLRMNEDDDYENIIRYGKYSSPLQKFSECCSQLELRKIESDDVPLIMKLTKRPLNVLKVGLPDKLIRLIWKTVRVPEALDLQVDDLWKYCSLTRSLLCQLDFRSPFKKEIYDHFQIPLCSLIGKKIKPVHVYAAFTSGYGVTEIQNVLYCVINEDDVINAFHRLNPVFGIHIDKFIENSQSVPKLYRMLKQIQNAVDFYSAFSLSSEIESYTLLELYSMIYIISSIHYGRTYGYDY